MKNGETPEFTRCLESETFFILHFAFCTLHFRFARWSASELGDQDNAAASSFIHVRGPSMTISERAFHLIRCLSVILFLALSCLSRAQTTPAPKEKPAYLPPRLWEILKDMEPPEVKKLRGDDTFIFVQEVGDETSLAVTIRPAKAGTKILYSQITVKVLDESGNEFPARKANPKEDAFSGSHVALHPGGGDGSQTGEYLFIEKKGHRVASVELTREGEKLTFQVHQVIGTITDEDLGLPKRGTK
jgi:hypothetical protein